jgi:hypothetical protein
VVMLVGVSHGDCSWEMMTDVGGVVGGVVGGAVGGVRN